MNANLKVVREGEAKRPARKPAKRRSESAIKAVQAVSVEKYSWPAPRSRCWS